RDVCHVDGRDEVLAVAPDYLLTRAQPCDQGLLPRPRPDEQTAAHDTPGQLCRIVRFDHAFHRYDGRAHPGPRWRGIERRRFVQPAITTIDVSHDDALLDVLGDSGPERSIEQAPCPFRAQAAVVFPAPWRSRVGRNGRRRVN